MAKHLFLGLLLLLVTRAAVATEEPVVMPSEYTLDTLPEPNNPAVTLREVPANNYAVIRFSGLAGEDKVAAKAAELKAWLEGRGIEPLGNPELARYNPLWTLPFLRRNEVMIPYQ